VRHAGNDTTGSGFASLEVTPLSRWRADPGHFLLIQHHRSRTHPPGRPATWIGRTKRSLPSGEQEVRPLMNTQTTTRQRFYLDGEPVEYWEDPNLPFRCTADDLQSYATRGDWVMLFNALTLLSVPVQAE
jgi:hypothetical protein